MSNGASHDYRIHHELNGARNHRPKGAVPRMKNGSNGTPHASFDHHAFTEAFLEAARDVPSATDPVTSAAALRRLIKTRLLAYTDMREQPEKFFLAHRLLSSAGLGGFGIRFTVQFNLFAGSILGLGSREQVGELDAMQAEGSLGCFLLTETSAGVLSGLIVHTTCTYDEQTDGFVLHTPSDAAAKNWISQGYTAELGVVIADLRVRGVSRGPHPFLMRLRDGPNGRLLPGIRVADMGTKTVANDLDNARVWFDGVRLPRRALLSRFADIVDGRYVQLSDERMRIEVIGQRLLTGRLAIAESALICSRAIHLRTQSYAMRKTCNGLAGEVALAQLPQLRTVLADAFDAFDQTCAFAAGVESRLNECLRSGTIPDADLVDASALARRAATRTPRSRTPHSRTPHLPATPHRAPASPRPSVSVCKIRCIDVAIERMHALRQEVGSYALMHATGFELVDLLLCCKFAEGDSRILLQKLARDRLKRVQREGLIGTLRCTVSEGYEAFAALRLARKLGAAGKDVAKLAAAMDENWRESKRLLRIPAHGRDWCPSDPLAPHPYPHPRAPPPFQSTL